MRKLALLIGSLALVAGCSLLNPTPIAKTAAESPLIPQTCRDSLTGRGQVGVNLLNETDVKLGYWAVEGNPTGDVNNELYTFKLEAWVLLADCTSVDYLAWPVPATTLPATTSTTVPGCLIAEGCVPDTVAP